MTVVYKNPLIDNKVVGSVEKMLIGSNVTNEALSSKTQRLPLVDTPKVLSLSDGKAKNGSF